LLKKVSEDRHAPLGGYFLLTALTGELKFRNSYYGKFAVWFLIKSGDRDTPDHAIGYAMHYGRSHNAVIRVYDDAGSVSETHERKGANSSRNLWRHTRILRCLLSSPKSQRHRRNRL
jgi:hypothetical protein